MSHDKPKIPAGPADHYVLPRSARLIKFLLTELVEAMAEITQVITHPGVFHADDVFSVAWLRRIGCTAPVKRTRDISPEEMADPNVIVLDVGNVYDVSTRCFDHHQQGGPDIADRESGVPYASFGLVFGALSVDTPVTRRMEQKLIQPIDAADNGWGELTGTRPYITLSGVTHLCNYLDEDSDEAFNQAVAWALPIIKCAEKAAGEWVTAKDAIEDAPIEGGVMVLDKYYPWQEHVLNQDKFSDLFFVAHPGSQGGWVATQIPKEFGSFEGRLSYPSDWRGLHGADLAKVAGFDDAVFVHNAGFIGGCESKENTIAMANKAINLLVQEA